VKFIFNLIITTLCILPAAHSQVVLNATGSTLKNNTTIFEYSIGEVAITTLTSANNNCTQGLLQPNLKIQNPECDIINNKISFFENPTGDKLRIVGIHDWIRSYEMYAADGRLVKQENYFNNYIDITGLPAAGIYFIRLLPGCNGKYQVIKFMKR